MAEGKLVASTSSAIGRPASFASCAPSARVSGAYGKECTAKLAAWKASNTWHVQCTQEASQLSHTSAEALPDLFDLDDVM